MKCIIRNLVAASALTLCATASHAAILPFFAILNGPSESPANASPGTGFATVTLDTVANTLTLNVSFSGLTGTTSASHIHAATTTAFTGTAGVATTTPTFAGFPLGVTSGTYSNTLDMTQASSYNPAFVTANGGTTATAQAALFAAIQANKSYLNIHTTTFPGGEIRGFITAAPEPGTLSLMGGLGLFSAAFVLRRRR